MNKKYRVTLTDDERNQLRDLLSAGKAPAPMLMHARILLKTDENGESPVLSDAATGEALDVNHATIGRVRQRFVELGVEAALIRRKSRHVYRHLVDGELEADLVALARSAPPDGYERWTLRLLAEKLVEWEFIDSISHETVRQVLRRTNSSIG